MACDLFEGLTRLFAGECLGFCFVGEYYVHIVLDDVVQESAVGFDYIIRRHIDGYEASRFLCQFHCLAHKGLVLNQISFDVEIVVAFEHLCRQISGNKFQRRS